jgi:hypothetical protein
MSDNSIFRDLTGERDPVWTEFRTTAAVASGTRPREFRVRVPDKCSLTRVDVQFGTAGLPAAARLYKVKVWALASGGVAASFASKGYAQVTMAATSTLHYNLHTLAAITLPAGSLVALALITGNPTGVAGTKYGLYFTKGHIQA